MYANIKNANLSNQERDLLLLKENPNFTQLTKESRDNILASGLTQEQFDRMSILEKENTLECL